MSQAKRLFWPTSRCLSILALALSLAGSLRPASAATIFSMISSPQSWVGGGETVTITSEDGFEFSAVFLADAIASFSMDNYRYVSDDQPPRWWTLDLAAPLYESLAVGHYAGATKYPFQGYGQSGLNFEGNGRGVSAVTGSFDVLEVVSAQDGTIISFAADFVQYDEGVEGWWNKGAIRFNSQLPIVLIPDPIGGGRSIVSDPIEDLTPTPPGSDSSFPGDRSELVPPDPDPDNIFPPSRNLPIEGSETDPIILPPVPLPGDFDESPSISWPIINPGLRTWPPEDSTFDDFTGVGNGPTPVDPAPGPLPVAAALVGWQSSRVLRRRCRKGV